MGQKVNPYSLRVGYIKTWKSRWFAKKKDFAGLLYEDINIKKYIKKNFASASIADIVIERASERLRVIIHSARPGIIIGRKGADIDRLREELNNMTGKEIYIDIKEIKNPYVEPQLIGANIAYQLEKRVAFKRAMKRAVQMAMERGAKGIRIRCSGRLGGAEIARSEAIMQGSIPLHTFRANVEYGFTEAHTTYGQIGIKVWVYKGEIILGKKTEEETPEAPVANQGEAKE
ncbi:MAG: 30S ribosomal protein S3 [Candidatus Omnitrophota bacterium]